MNFYSILTRKFGTPFTYSSESELEPGSLAKINFNNRQTTGIVIQKTDRPEHDVKPIDDLLLESGLTQTHIDLCKWIAEYYHCGLDKCIKLFLPEIAWSGKQPKREQIVTLEVPLEEALEATKRSKKQSEIVKVIHKQKSLNLEHWTLNENCKLKIENSALKALQFKSLITITKGEILSSLPTAKYTLPTTHPLTSDQEKVLDQIKESKNNQFLLHGITGSGKTEIYLHLIQQSLKKDSTINNNKLSPDTCPERSLGKGRCPVSPDRGVSGDAPLRGTEGIKTQPVLRSLSEEGSDSPTTNYQLPTTNYPPQALLLVPEIALTTQLIQYFQHHLPHQISVIHSNLSDSERLQEWHRIRSGDSKLIIGSRSALFTPWRNLKLIILDEEHEWTYKQESTPRYHTREVAEKIVSLVSSQHVHTAGGPERATKQSPEQMDHTQTYDSSGTKSKSKIVELSEIRRWRENSETDNCSPLLLLLGSATPSIETYFSCHTERSRLGGRVEGSEIKSNDTREMTAKSTPTTSYHLLSLPSRANNSELPPIKVLDLRNEINYRNFTMIAEELQKGIRKRLDKNEQIILFLNKRGFASSLLCRTCGYSPQCQNCSVSLTLHHLRSQNMNKTPSFQKGGAPLGGAGVVGGAYLICHYCGEAVRPPTLCPECKGVNLKEVGAGTAKVEQQLRTLFPIARILRADKDTTTSKTSWETIYNKMKNHEADILIGTQMIAKGLDLPKVTLVGVLLADIGLHIPDFRAGERVFQLLTQVAGRAGRHAPGEVVIQTYNPDHPSIRFAKKHDYLGFYNHEIKVRETYHYPPFTEIIRLTYKHPNRETAKTECLRLSGELEDRFEISCGLERGSTSTSTQKNKPQITITHSPNLFPRLHGKYIWHIYVKGQNPNDLIRELRLPRGWIVDRNPT